MHTAITWLLKGEGVTEQDLSFGGCFACYTFNLPTSYNDEMADIMDEMFEVLKRRPHAFLHLAPTSVAR